MMYLRTPSQEYCAEFYGKVDRCGTSHAMITLLVRVTICYCRDIIQIITIPNARRHWL